MIEIFERYITKVIENTFGFTPKVRILMPNEGVIKVFLDGNESERKQMMGHHAQNFKALKQLLICFGRKHNIYAFLFIEFPDAETNSY